MKIENLDAIETYPTNYDNIDKKTRDIIVEYLNDQQALAELYYKHHIEYEQHEYNHDDNELPRYLRLYQHQMTLICGGKNLLSVLGINAEYNWPGHPHEWFLATRADAQAYAELPVDYTPDDLRTENILHTNGLISFEDINRGNRWKVSY